MIGRYFERRRGRGLPSRVAVRALLVLVACGSDRSAYFEMPPEEASQQETAYIAAVLADADGDDLEQGEGEYVLLRTNWDRRTDVGGWWVEDRDGNRLNVGVGTQIEPGSELRLHPACGEDTGVAIFSCLGREVLDDDGDVLVLRDSAGGHVADFGYERPR